MSYFYCKNEVAFKTHVNFDIHVLLRSMLIQRTSCPIELLKAKGYDN